jgi:histidinol-phosphate aminotransferase
MMQPRKAVQEMLAYSPPTQGRDSAIRLDFNENTVGCSPSVTVAVAQALSANSVAMYPEYSSAREIISLFFNVDSEQMAITNGTDEAIQLLVNTFMNAGDELIITSPSYAMYRFYAELSGVVVKEVKYLLDDNLSFPMDELLRAITPSTKAVFIANPNNPTGGAISIPEIRRILDAAPNAMVLIDEAYVEFCGVTAIGLLREYENLFISRTMSKAYGMAGLRCGFLFSSASNMGWVRKAQSPYSVNFVAITAAVAAIKDKAYVENYVNQVVQARSYVSAELSRLGIRHFKSDGNFVLFMVGKHAERIVSELRNAGVLVRNRSHECEGSVRVTVGTKGQMELFIQELEKAL